MDCNTAVGLGLMPSIVEESPDRVSNLLMELIESFYEESGRRGQCGRLTTAPSVAARNRASEPRALASGVWDATLVDSFRSLTVAVLCRRLIAKNRARQQAERIGRDRTLGRVLNGPRQLLQVLAELQSNHILAAAPRDVPDGG